MANKYFLDSSAWIEYYDGTPKGKQIQAIVEQEQVTTSLLVIAEIADRFMREGEDSKVFISFIQKTATIFQITLEITLEAVSLKNKWRKQNQKFGLMDGFHLAMAEKNNCSLITADNDFAKVPNVRII